MTCAVISLNPGPIIVAIATFGHVDMRFCFIKVTFNIEYYYIVIRFGHEDMKFYFR